VDEKMREKMVLALENAVRVAGARDYEEGMKQAKKLIDFADNGIQSIQTIEGLRKTLDSCLPTSKSEEKVVLLAIKLLPQLLRVGLKMAAKKAVSALPPPPAGRPRVTTANKTQEVLIFISELHRKGCSLKVAKGRASRRFEISLRTIERLWSNRGSVHEDEPTFKEVLRFIQTGESPSGQSGLAN
jgi:hypothetical protein